MLLSNKKQGTLRDTGKERYINLYIPVYIYLLIIKYSEQYKIKREWSKGEHNKEKLG